MADMRVQNFYRATSFGEPIGPWRDSLRDVWADLEADQLGSFDDYGQFYVTVPGGMLRRSIWVEFEEVERRPPRRLTCEQRARLHARR